MTIRGDRLAIIAGLFAVLVVTIVILAAQRGSNAPCGGGKESASVSLTYGSDATGYATVREAVTGALRAAELPEARNLTAGSRITVGVGGDVELTTADGSSIRVHRARGIEGDGILFDAVSICR